MGIVSEPRVLRDDFIEEDSKNESRLRPVNFSEYIGQRKILENIKLWLPLPKFAQKQWIMFCFQGHQV